jgi:hypothetical protein
MKKQNLTLSIALAAIFSASTAIAEAEVTGKIVYETAKFTNAGSTIGAAAAHGKEVFKSETSARIYIDGEVSDDATYHIELQGFTDGKAGANYKGNEGYTQRDVVREAYVDTQQGDWSIRAGKQQVVWGTADGMKLLDMINPTDYAEMAQNQMEDSRVPVWMVNAETTYADGSELQVVVSQPKENVFAGLNRNVNTDIRKNEDPTQTGIKDRAAIGHNQGHAFIMKGVDSITGADNGFLNIVPDMGSTAANFGNAFEGLGGITQGGLKNPLLDSFTVGAFTSGATLEQLSGMFDMMMGNDGTTDQFANLNFATQLDMALGGNGDLTVWNQVKGSMTGKQALEFYGNMYSTNLYNPDAEINSAFEYMDRTPFSTFDDFVNAQSQYVYNMPDTNELDLAFRTKKSLENGMNYSLNYAYAYDKNPIINLRWKNAAGDTLTTIRTAKNLDLDMNGTLETNTAVLTITDGVNNYGGNEPAGPAILEFSQEVKRVHNIGGSFDYGIDSAELGPVVLRGEFLYLKDTYTPVMDRGALSIGDLPAALSMRKGDRAKFVLGADITAMTNMMVSAQIIQDRNLDYVNDNTDWDGSSCTGKLNCGVYTTDYATMHLTNGFNKAEKNKEFYSLFFSKPFGESGQHRWNNITMYEENGGKWNRFDIDYSIDDDTQATLEYNKYWGNENTQFGQLKNASNIQVGVKYSF